MATYVSVDLALRDVQDMRTYRKRVDATIERYGGNLCGAREKGKVIDGGLAPPSHGDSGD